GEAQGGTAVDPHADEKMAVVPLEGNGNAIIRRPPDMLCLRVTLLDVFQGRARAWIGEHRQRESHQRNVTQGHRGTPLNSNTDAAAREGARTLRGRPTIKLRRGVRYEPPWVRMTHPGPLQGSAQPPTQRWRAACPRRRC